MLNHRLYGDVERDADLRGRLTEDAHAMPRRRLRISPVWKIRDADAQRDVRASRCPATMRLSAAMRRRCASGSRVQFPRVSLGAGVPAVLLCEVRYMVIVEVVGAGDFLSCASACAADSGPHVGT